MSAPQSSNNPAGRDSWLWVVATLGVILIAIAVRWAVNFSTPYPPGTDAGYYPMQTQAWLIHNRLMYDDLPLLFWMNAGLAKVLIWHGTPLDRAVLLVSRILDSVLQPLTAIAIMATGYAWSGGRRRALAGCIAATVLAVLSTPIMQMLSDFQKNSLGFVWMAAAIWACRSAMIVPTPGRWALLVSFMILAALTHIGAFAVTSLIICGALLIWYWKTSPHRHGRSWFAVFGGIATLITAVMLYLEPSRTEGMLRAPMGLFSAQPFQWPTLPNLVLAVIVIAVAMRWVWRERRELPDGDVALILAMAATLAFLIVPKRPEYFYRLSLMSTVPGSFLIAFILTRRATLDRYSWAHGALLLAGATVIGVLAPLAAPQPFIVPNAVAELQQFQRQIREPQSTLVIAPHGLEWWAGYFLQTPVGIKVKDAASSRYNRALLLQQTRAFKPPYAGPGFSPQPPGPPAPSAQRIYAGHYIEVYELRAKASAR